MLSDARKEAILEKVAAPSGAFGEGGLSPSWDAARGKAKVKYDKETDAAGGIINRKLFQRAAAKRKAVPFAAAPTRPLMSISGASATTKQQPPPAPAASKGSAIDLKPATPDRVKFYYEQMKLREQNKAK